MTGPRSEWTPPQFEEHLKRLRLAGRFDEARALLARLAAQPGELAEWARRLQRAHAPLWWADVQGRRCRLRRRGARDREAIRRLWQAPGFVARFNPGAPPLPAGDDALTRILSLEHAALPAQSRSLHWMLETRQGAAFGVASLVDINFAHRRAEFLIGVHEPPYAGCAAEATLLAIDFAFQQLGLRKLVALVPLANTPSLESARHIGFVDEGVLREHLIDPATGQPIDMAQLALLASDPTAGQRQERVRRRLLGT